MSSPPKNPSGMAMTDTITKTNEYFERMKEAINTMLLNPTKLPNVTWPITAPLAKFTSQYLPIHQIMAQKRMRTHQTTIGARRAGFNAAFSICFRGFAATN